MMDYSKGIEFVRKFRYSIYEDKQKDIEEKYTGSNKNYTDVIKEIVTSLIGDNKDIKNYSEYFKIDYTGWTSTVHENKYGVHIYEWTFDFAIEHENNNRDWTYELLKLSFVKADVRIVIGYVDNSNRENELEIIRSQVECFKNSVAESEEFYVILMNRTLTYTNENKPPFGMKVYSITGKMVDDITDYINEC